MERLPNQLSCRNDEYTCRDYLNNTSLNKSESKNNQTRSSGSGNADEAYSYINCIFSRRQVQLA